MKKMMEMETEVTGMTCVQMMDYLNDTAMDVNGYTIHLHPKLAEQNLKLDLSIEIDRKKGDMIPANVTIDRIFSRSISGFIPPGSTIIGDIITPQDESGVLLKLRGNIIMYTTGYGGPYGCIRALPPKITTKIEERIGK
ncbi:MAG: hypothetical protein PVI90_00825 [Desulfobacteraceae bacterium]